METTAVTMGEMVDRASLHADRRDEFVYTKFMLGTFLSPGLAAMNQQQEGLFWILTAIASWVRCTSEPANPEGEVDAEGFDECGMAEARYLALKERWPCLVEHMQHFELRRRGPHGAELCIGGGADADEDDSLTMHPIQRWSYAQIPWSDDEPLRVYASQAEINDGSNSDRVWVLMLAREY